MTVSRVLNDRGEISSETRARVQKAIDELGYRPSAVARSLMTNRTMRLGMMIPDITNPFFPEVVRGVEDTAWEQGYTVTLCNTVEDQDREKAMLRLLEDDRVDGLVLCSARLPDEGLIPLLKRHAAVVLVNRTVPGGVADSVEVDDAHGTMRAMNHLLEKGRRTIGFLMGPATSSSARKRLLGYRSALETRGWEVDADIIRTCFPNEEGGYEIGRSLLQDRPDINALICYNDLVAIGALKACADLGIRIPENVAVVGCDDIRLASLVTPALTTLRVAKYDLGATAARILLNRVLEKGEEENEVLLKPELVLRESAP